MRLVYAREAVTDLERLREFIASHDPGAAARVAADLLTRINHLCAFPELGRSVDHAPNPNAVRDFTLGKYVVRYILHDDALVILRIWHQFESR